MKYIAAMGRFSQEDVNIIGPILYEELGGAFKPQDIVDYATPKNSPLHKYFEWDDKKAAIRYRRRTARNMAKAVLVIEGEQEVNLFHSIKDKQTRAMVDIKTIRGNPQWMAQITKKAMQQAMSWSKRYQHLKALTEIHKAIRQTGKKLKKAS